MSENTLLDTRKDPPLAKSDDLEDLESQTRPLPTRKISRSKPTYDLEDTKPPQLPRRRLDDNSYNAVHFKSDRTLSTVSSPDIEQGLQHENQQDFTDEMRTQDSESSLPRQASGGLEVPRDLRESGNIESATTDAAIVMTPRDLGTSEIVMTSVATDATTVIMGNTTSARRQGTNASSFATTVSSVSGTDEAHPGALFLSPTDYGVNDVIVEEENVPSAGQESAEASATKPTLAPEAVVEESGKRRAFCTQRRLLVIAATALLLAGGVFAAVYFLVVKDNDSGSTAAAGSPTEPPIGLQKDKDFRDLTLKLSGLDRLSPEAIDVWENVSAEHFINAYQRNASLGIRDLTTTYTFKSQIPVDPHSQVDRFSDKDIERSSLTISFDQTVSYLDLGSTLSGLPLAQYPFETEALQNAYMKALRTADPTAFGNVTSVSLVDQTLPTTSEPTPSPTPVQTPFPGTPEPTPSAATFEPTPPPIPENSTPEPSPTPYPTAAEEDEEEANLDPGAGK